MARTKKVAWYETLEGALNYEAVRKDAQAKANETGFDYGLERNDVFRCYRAFMLPAKINRRGFELRCEVVSCAVLEHCQKGHGPL